MGDLLAWPIVILIIVIVFLLVFQRNIRGLIDRTKSVKLPGGFHAEGVEPAQQQLTAKAELEPLTTEQLGSPMKEALYEPLENALRRQIIASVPDSKYHFDWALRSFAMAAVQHRHEFRYRLIFGSQIKALKVAVQSGGLLHDRKMKEFYDQAAFNFPEAYANFNYTQWRSFFAHQELATEAGDGDLKLTPEAYSFMSFLAISGVTDEKLF